MRRLIALLLLGALGGACAAESLVCYGDLSGGICTPPELRVQPAGTITLPGDLWADSDEPRLTLIVSLRTAHFVMPPTVVGDAAVLSSSEKVFAVASDGPFALTGLRVAGELQPGDDIVADVRLLNPNTATVLFDAPVLLARLAGVTEIELFMLNPADNLTQQTFVRVVNVDARDARVRIIPIDDAGHAGGEAVAHIPAGAAVQLNSVDLADGNAAKGLSGGFGAGVGKWRAALVADARVRAQLFVRNTETGTLSALSEPQD